MLVVGVAVVVIAIDQATKYWALNDLGPARKIDVLGPLRFNLQFNTGMAFSTGSGSGAIIGIVALVVVGVLLFFASKMTSRWQLFLVGAIVGGALGNIIDRLTRVGATNPYTGEVAQGFMSGAVVDFIDVQFWPVWNVADMGVVVGGIALAIFGAFAPVDSDDPDSDDPGSDDTATESAASAQPDASGAEGRDGDE